MTITSAVVTVVVAVIGGSASRCATDRSGATLPTRLTASALGGLEIRWATRTAGWTSWARHPGGELAAVSWLDDDLPRIHMGSSKYECEQPAVRLWPMLLIKSAFDRSRQWRGTSTIGVAPLQAIAGRGMGMILAILRKF